MSSQINFGARILFRQIIKSFSYLFFNKLRSFIIAFMNFTIQTLFIGRLLVVHIRHDIFKVQLGPSNSNNYAFQEGRITHEAVNILSFVPKVRSTGEGILITILASPIFDTLERISKVRILQEGLSLILVIFGG